MEEITTNNSDFAAKKQMVLALFGLGRAGTFHLKNIIAHSDIKLKYIIEMDTVRSNFVRKKYHLDDVTFLTPKV